MRIPRGPIFVAFAVAWCCFFSSEPLIAQLVAPGSGKQWTTTWSDEFNTGPSDLTGWSYDLGGGGWGNQELEVYTNSPQNAYIATDSGTGAGALHIDVIATGTGSNQSYTSARIKTTNVFSQAYGLFEFRAKLPVGQGLWPALWMMSKDEIYGGWPRSGEIDVLESVGQDSSLVQGSLHSGSDPNHHVTQTRTFDQSGLEPAGFSTAAWHTYDLEWNKGSANVPATFKWYVDGILYQTQSGGWTIPSGVAPTNKDAPFDQPFYILMNVAVGGFYPGAPNLAPGTYGMQVDYVRAYQRISSTATPAWDADASGNWSDADNWANNVVPNAAGAAAQFGDVLTQPRVVHVDTPITTGSISFDSISGYTLSGTQTITLSTSSAPASINVISGNHTIDAPLALSRNTNVTITPPDSSLTVTSPSIADGLTLTKSGAGVLALRNIRSAGSLNIAAGIVEILPDGTDAGTSKLKSLQVSGGAAMDLANNALIIDYTGPVGALVGNTRLMIASGQLTSSSADSSHRIGYLDNATRGLATFSGQSVDASSILIKFTYAGDSNLDGQVDVTDLGALATHWQTSGVWSDGDFNYDGLVDVADLGILATDWQLGREPGTPGAPSGPGSLQAALASVGLGTGVPEPTVVGATCLLALLCLRRR